MLQQLAVPWSILCTMFCGALAAAMGSLSRARQQCLQQSRSIVEREFSDGGGAPRDFTALSATALDMLEDELLSEQEVGMLLMFLTSVID
jgi:hypothetical protein